VFNAGVDVVRGGRLRDRLRQAQTAGERLGALLPEALDPRVAETAKSFARLWSLLLFVLECLAGFALWVVSVCALAVLGLYASVIGVSCFVGGKVLRLLARGSDWVLAQAYRVVHTTLKTLHAEGFAGESLEWYLKEKADEFAGVVVAWTQSLDQSVPGDADTMLQRAKAILIPDDATFDRFGAQLLGEAHALSLRRDVPEDWRAAVAEVRRARSDADAVYQEQAEQIRDVEEVAAWTTWALDSLSWIVWAYALTADLLKKGLDKVSSLLGTRTPAGLPILTLVDLFKFSSLIDLTTAAGNAVVQSVILGKQIYDVHDIFTRTSVEVFGLYQREMP
jgi:hypothetical protein